MNVFFSDLRSIFIDSVGQCWTDCLLLICDSEHDNSGNKSSTATWSLRREKSIILTSFQFLTRTRVYSFLSYLTPIYYHPISARNVSISHYYSLSREPSPATVKLILVLVEEEGKAITEMSYWYPTLTLTRPNRKI